MPNLSALSRGTQILAAAALLLLIDTFLAWQDFEGIVSQNAWHGFWGVVMGLLVIVLLAWVIARIMDVRLPVDVPDGLVTVALGGLIFLFALLKNLTDDFSAIWSYIGVLLAAAVAYGAWLRYQEAGGTVESLKAAIPRPAPSSSTGGPGGTTMDREPDVTPTAAPEAPRPAEPAPPSPRTTEPMTQTGPTPPSGASAPARPTEPSAPTGPEAPPEPSQPSAPETAPSEPEPPAPADETESERPRQPPPSSSGTS